MERSMKKLHHYLGVELNQQTWTLLENKKRDKLLEKFSNMNYPLVVHYPLPMNEQPAYKNIFCSNDNFPVAKVVSQEIVSIPMHPYLTESDQIKIIQLL